jgi:hypothetical protein
MSSMIVQIVGFCICSYSNSKRMLSTRKCALFTCDILNHCSLSLVRLVSFQEPKRLVERARECS